VKKTIPPATVLAVALAAAFPAAAQSNAEIMQELQQLRSRVGELEKQLKEAQAKPAAAAGAAAPQWGMTPEQAAEFNRIAIKTESLQDNFIDQGFQGLTISGQMQAAYVWTQAQNLAGFQFLDSVASYGYNYWNSYVGMAMLDIQKEMEGGTKWRLTLTPQRGSGSVIDGYSIVNEASVSIPLTDLQTRFIAGQIPDWSGYEYLQPTLNKLITHNLLFDFTLPTGYIGAGLELTSGKWLTKVMAAQMNQNANDPGQRGSVLAFRVDYSKGEFEGFGAAGVWGKAPNFVNGDPDGDGYYDNSKLGLIEVDGYFVRGDWSVFGQLSYGRQANAAITADANGNLQTASWYGASGLAAYKFTPRLEGAVRFDYINNARNGGGLLGYGIDSNNGVGPDGNLGCVQGAAAVVPGCDTGADRYALSVGLNYLFNNHTMFKAEYRYDWARQPVFLFVDDGIYRKSTNLFGASVVVFF
jgi:hypothetical protein